jgi:hypothetical protein
VIPAAIQGLIFIATAIFVAGGIVKSSRKEQDQTKIDVSRIGTKQRDEEKAAARRHHNVSLVIVAMTDSKEDRFKIAGMLKED